MPRLVLGSASPRRKELMKQVGFTFEVRPSLYDEVIPEDTHPEDVVQYLAEQKNQAIPSSTNEVVVTADTVVCQGGQVLGKPKSYKDAYSMLKQLSGKRHSVYTGVSIRDFNHWVSFAVCTNVYLLSLSQAKMEWYLGKEESWDKAGSYGIQGAGALLVEKIEGDYNNVVGLPMSRLARELDTFMIKPG
ncbi:Maf family protein [Halobacillus shinanisalinarum]|uniref:dTTP/UTP pyrophosphatase n=1 Tax=Halobacillus shinanisalinarum TaxID=2932258 RepID=A0ABY4H0I9_9BACI|nr:Maf family protein [Halobacillus shinanisalinarum]UOQ93878.1 Maf family protein [Halobacillus shinanisalinarum]